MPGTTIVRYKTHPEQAEANATLVKAVFDALARTRPTGVRYQCLRAPDGVSFTHVATIDPVAGVHPLTGLPEFQAFIAGLGQRCVEPPMRVESERIGHYEG
jgi:hypothetical protein